MRILVDALSAREGGGVTYVRHAIPAIARAAAAAGHELEVLLSPRYQAELIAALPAQAQPRAADLPGADVLRRLWYLQTAVPELIRRERFDLLFTVVEAGAIRPRCPHVVMARNLNTFAPLRNASGMRGRLALLAWRATREPVARLTLGGAHRIVCVSDTFRRLLVDRVGIDRDRTEVVHHGVDPGFANDGTASPHPRPLDGRPYLLAVSTIARHKNYETLLEAYARTARRTATPLLAIAGGVADQTLHELLISRARALGVDDRVLFLGRVPHDRLPALYANATAFVFPSLLETFGMPLAEAMAAGVPVIASDLPVCREVGGDAPLFFEPESPDGLSACLVRVLEEDTMREALAQRSRQRGAHFSWDRTAHRMVEIFEAVRERASDRRL